VGVLPRSLAAAQLHWKQQLPSGGSRIEAAMTPCPPVRTGAVDRHTVSALTRKQGHQRHLLTRLPLVALSTSVGHSYLCSHTAWQPGCTRQQPPTSSLAEVASPVAPLPGQAHSACTDTEQQVTPPTHQPASNELTALGCCDLWVCCHAAWQPTRSCMEQLGPLGSSRVEEAMPPCPAVRT